MNPEEMLQKMQGAKLVGLEEADVAYLTELIQRDVQNIEKALKSLDRLKDDNLRNLTKAAMENDLAIAIQLLDLFSK